MPEYCRIWKTLIIWGIELGFLGFSGTLTYQYVLQWYDSSNLIELGWVAVVGRVCGRGFSEEYGSSLPRGRTVSKSTIPALDDLFSSSVLFSYATGAYAF